MENKVISKAMSDEWNVLVRKGYNVAYLSLYGSQNYGLDIDTPQYKSDIDFKAVIIPSLDDLVNNSKPLSVVLESKNGQCDVKDIRVYIETLLKANPAYLETLFTPYYMINSAFTNEMNEIKSLRNELVIALRYQFVRATYGMMCEKEKAMCHPYPTIADKIAKYGIDNKQVHHIYRLYLLLREFVENGSVSFVPAQSEIDELIKIKINGYELKESKAIAHKYMTLAKKLKEDYLSVIDEKTIDYSVRDRILDLSKQIIKNSIITTIRGKK